PDGAPTARAGGLEIVLAVVGEMDAYVLAVTLPQMGVHLGIGPGVGLAFPFHEGDIEYALQFRAAETRSQQGAAGRSGYPGIDIEYSRFRRDGCAVAEIRFGPAVVRIGQYGGRSHGCQAAYGPIQAGIGEDVKGMGNARQPGLQGRIGRRQMLRVDGMDEIAIMPTLHSMQLLQPPEGGSILVPKPDPGLVGLVAGQPQKGAHVEIDAIVHGAEGFESGWIERVI